MVERKETFSYLTENHINEIISLYLGYKNVDNRAAIIDLQDIVDSENCLMTVSKYVKTKDYSSEIIDIPQLVRKWKLLSNEMHRNLNNLKLLLYGNS